MSTATIRIESGVARPMRQEHFAQSNSETIALNQNAERALSGSHAHEEWMRSIEEAWQGHLETLQQQVCELLLKNQQLRMALITANAPERERRNARNL